MPYTSIAELPPAIRDHLPGSAQELFVAAFNAAWASYRGPDPQERERRAFRIAWAAVKHSYEKLEGRWILKQAVL